MTVSRIDLARYAYILDGVDTDPYAHQSRTFVFPEVMDIRKIRR